MVKTIEFDIKNEKLADYYCRLNKKNINFICNYIIDNNLKFVKKYDKEYKLLIIIDNVHSLSQLELFLRHKGIVFMYFNLKYKCYFVYLDEDHSKDMELLNYNE